MDRNGRMFDERNRASDAFLSRFGLRRNHQRFDSNCLFRAVAELQYGSRDLFPQVRDECVLYMRRNVACFSQLVGQNFDTYVDNMAMARTHGTLLELRALALYHGVQVFLYTPNREGEHYVYHPRSPKVWRIFYEGIHYFDAVFGEQNIELEPRDAAPQDGPNVTQRAGYVPPRPPPAGQYGNLQLFAVIPYPQRNQVPIRNIIAIGPAMSERGAPLGPVFTPILVFLGSDRTMPNLPPQIGSEPTYMFASIPYSYRANRGDRFDFETDEEPAEQQGNRR